MPTVLYLSDLIFQKVLIETIFYCSFEKVEVKESVCEIGVPI